LKIWMAFLFFIGSILFLMQLHMRFSCNYTRILVYYWLAIFICFLNDDFNNI